MTKRFPIYLLFVAVMSAFVAGCNSKDSDSIIEGDYQNASITSLRLKANSKILANLDSVFFSIDLNSREIFNADSLPINTKINRLQLSIGTPTISGCEITFRPAGADKDTTVNYLTNPNDSIDFSTGPAKIKVISYNGQNTQEYTLRVNVHNSEPDSLTWGRVAWRTLPSLFERVDEQKTVEFEGKPLCLTTYAGAASVALLGADGEKWTIEAADLPADAVVSSMQAVGTTLYIITGSGQLYKSADKAKTWSATGAVMNHLYGAYGDMLLGARRDADGWKHVTWPATAEKDVPAGCPVAGTSQLLSYTTEWSTTPMAIMAGGSDALGRLTGDVWAYDNGIWALISKKPMSPASGMTLVPYFAYRTNAANWKVTKRTALIAMGGRSQNGYPRTSLYVSYDRGLNWNLSDTLMCLPPYIPAFYDAQAVVVPEMMSVDGSRLLDDEWTSCPSAKIPAWYRIVDAMADDSRVTRPVTEWECPYIYLFGGVNSLGATSNTVWRGVINRLTFRPLY